METGTARVMQAQHDVADEVSRRGAGWYADPPFPTPSTVRPPSSSPPTLFEACWLAEVVRRHEARNGLLEDEAALAAARAQPADFQTRLLKRAEVLGTREGWREVLWSWRLAARRVLVLAVVLALAAGAGLVAGLLGDGSRAVNVVWALGGLLGPHLLGLLLWAGGMMLAGRLAPGRSALPSGPLPRLGLRLVQLLDRAPGAADRLAALATLMTQQRLGAWAAAWIGHLLWAAVLAGASLGLLLMLAIRRYDFVWETTILPAHVFVSVATALGQVPAWLGFPVPDAGIVEAGGLMPQQTPFSLAARQAWSGWLLGCVLVYGLLLRLMCALLCVLMWRRACARLGPDLAQAGHALLRERLLPSSTLIGVTDAAPYRLHRAALDSRALTGEGACLLALELPDELCWPPPWSRAADSSGIHDRRPLDLGRVDSRAERQALLERLTRHPPARLLVAIDVRMTPDRGSLGLIVTLARLARCTRIWALKPEPALADRLPLWCEAIERAGLGRETVLVDEAAVRAWLGAGESAAGRGHG